MMKKHGLLWWEVVFVWESKVPFTSKGAGHGIEQENRSIKVMAGIKGISNSSINLDEYFPSTAKISNIITSFCNKFCISESEACKREDHHQLTGWKNSRIRSNVSKISDIFSTYGVDFNATMSTTCLPWKRYQRKILNNF